MSSTRFAIGAGVVLVGAAAVIASSSGLPRGIRPGKLVATQASIDWKCPAPGSAGAGPTFVLRNEGDGPIRITGVKSGCGCVSATVEPRTIPPGGTATLAAVVDPIEVGARRVSIAVETDSPASPSVGLLLVVVGYRPPPYLLNVVADLYYPDGYEADEVREVRVEAVLPRSQLEATPGLACDLPFLAIEPPTIADSPHLNDPSLLVRSFRYRVRFASPPPAEGFEGTASLDDPWRPGQVRRIHVHGDASMPIRVGPSHPILTIAGPDDGAARIRIVARSRRPGRKLVAEAEGGDSSPIRVEPTRAGVDEDFTAFDVSWKPGRTSAPGPFRVVVRTDGPGVESVTVPVLVRRRAP